MADNKVAYIKLVGVRVCFPRFNYPSRYEEDKPYRLSCDVILTEKQQNLVIKQITDKHPELQKDVINSFRGYSEPSSTSKTVVSKKYPGLTGMKYIKCTKIIDESIIPVNASEEDAKRLLDQHGAILKLEKYIDKNSEPEVEIEAPTSSKHFTDNDFFFEEQESIIVGEATEIVEGKQNALELLNTRKEITRYPSLKSLDDVKRLNKEGNLEKVEVEGNEFRSGDYVMVNIAAVYSYKKWHYHLVSGYPIIKLADTDIEYVPLAEKTFELTTEDFELFE